MRLATASASPRRRRLLAWAAAATAAAGLRVPAVAAAPARMCMVSYGVSPFGVIDDQGRSAGMSIELAEGLSREAGVEIANVVVPYPRAVAMVASGEAELLFSLPNRALEKVALPIVPMFKGEIIVIGRPGTRYASLADLHGKLVGHIRGSEYGDAFQGDAAIRKYETISSKQTIQMLLEGRYDAAIGLRGSLFHAMRELKLPRDRLGAALHVGDTEVWLYMSRRAHNAPLAESLARAATTLRGNGVVNALQEKYFGGLPKD